MSVTRPRSGTKKGDLPPKLGKEEGGKNRNTRLRGRCSPEKASWRVEMRAQSPAVGTGAGTRLRSDREDGAALACPAPAPTLLGGTGAIVPGPGGSIVSSSRKSPELVHEGDFVVIENNAFNAMGSARSGLAELNGIIKFWLWRRGIQYVLVAPTTLKKFMLGHRKRREIVHYPRGF